MSKYTDGDISCSLRDVLDVLSFFNYRFELHLSATEITPTEATGW